MSLLYRLNSIFNINAELLLVAGWLFIVNVETSKNRNQADHSVPGLVIAKRWVTEASRPHDPW